MIHSEPHGSVEQSGSVVAPTGQSKGRNQSLCRDAVSFRRFLYDLSLYSDMHLTQKPSLVKRVRVPCLLHGAPSYRSLPVAQAAARSGVSGAYDGTEPGSSAFRKVLQLGSNS